MKTNKRYIPLDVMRGLTIIMMIFCNNIGSYVPSYLRHADWSGFTMVDWIFPSFIFCLGLSLLFSLKNVEKIDKNFVKKTLIRFLVLIFINYSIGFLSAILRNSKSCDSFSAAFITTMSNFRLTGVIFRLALLSLIVPFIIVLCKKNTKILICVSFSILVVYGILLGFFHGYEFSNQNIIYIVDNAIFTPAHLYHKGLGEVTLTLDPEGLLSTLPCIAHALIAYICGSLLLKKSINKITSIKLFIVGAIFILLSLPFHLTNFIPYNKTVWSPSFVILTCGISLVFLSIFNLIFTYEKSNKIFPVLKAFGANALFMYLFSTFIVIILNNFPVDYSLHSIHYFVNQGLTSMCLNNKTASEIIYALLLIVVSTPLALIFKKKKIYIKL